MRRIVTAAALLTATLSPAACSSSSSHPAAAPAPAIATSAAAAVDTATLQLCNMAKAAKADGADKMLANATGPDFHSIGAQAANPEVSAAAGEVWQRYQEAAVAGAQGDNTTEKVNLLTAVIQLDTACVKIGLG